MPQAFVARTETAVSEAQSRSLKVSMEAHQHQAISRLRQSRLGPGEGQLTPPIGSKPTRDAEVDLLLFTAVDSEIALIADNGKLGIRALVGQCKPCLHILRHRQYLKDAMPVRIEANGHSNERYMVNCARLLPRIQTPSAPRLNNICTHRRNTILVL